MKHNILAFLFYARTSIFCQCAPPLPNTIQYNTIQYVWIISFKKRGKWEIIELVCFPPASRLIWGWGIWWWGQKWSRTTIYEWDPDLTVHDSIFFHILLVHGDRWSFVAKAAIQISQKSYRGLASLMNYRQKTKGNAIKTWDCVFTHSKSQI